MGGRRHSPLLVAIGVVGVVAALPRVSAAQVLPQLTYEESQRLSLEAGAPAGEHDDTAMRRGLEFLAGLGAPVVAATAGAVVMGGDRDGVIPAAIAWPVAVFGLSLIATPIAVWAVGNARGGNGGYGRAFVGNLLGGIVGLGVGLAVGRSNICKGFDPGGDCIAGLVAASAFAAVASSGGAVLGYESSNDATDPPSRRGIALRLVPSFTPVRGGAVLGVGFAL